jgi:small subunit ribosomal protein S8
VLKDEGYIADFEARVDGVKPRLRLELKYFRGKPVIAEIDRASRPSLRRYAGRMSCPRCVAAWASPSCRRPGRDDRSRARAAGVGGEVLCTVF